MVLVDTSVWIRALANRPPYIAELDRLLRLDDVAGHDLVYGELLIGDKGGRLRVLKYYAEMQHAPAIPHEEVVAFVHARKLHGRGVGWIDIHLLASAIIGKMELWTADPRFVEVAEELGVGYRG
jgi:predicted nucleic acid-binding protein